MQGFWEYFVERLKYTEVVHLAPKNSFHYFYDVESVESEVRFLNNSNDQHEKMTENSNFNRVVAGTGRIIFVRFLTTDSTNFFIITLRSFLRNCIVVQFFGNGNCSAILSLAKVRWLFSSSTGDGNSRKSRFLRVPRTWWPGIIFFLPFLGA